jgi:hypothetical protein
MRRPRCATVDLAVLIYGLAAYALGRVTAFGERLATPLVVWWDSLEIVWLGRRDWSGWDFHRPDYDSALAWRIYAGWWLIRRYKPRGAERA